MDRVELTEQSSLKELGFGSRKNYTFNDKDGGECQESETPKEEYHYWDGKINAENKTLYRDEENSFLSMEVPPLNDKCEKTNNLSSESNGSIEGQEMCSKVLVANEVYSDSDPGTQQDEQCAKEVPQDTKASDVFRGSLGKKIALLVCCVSGTLLSATSYSLMTVFYPQEAQSRGISLTTVGFVFGIFELVVFFVSPIAGKYTARIGVKFVCLSGIFIEGCSAALFGVLHRCPDGVTFAVMSVACRCVQALGFACFCVATLSVGTHYFNKSAALVVAVIESTMSTGLMIGPVLGGFLYEAGGFSLPFFVNGFCILLNGLAMFVFLPDTKDSNNDRKQASMSRLFLSPLVVITMISVSFATGGSIMYLSLYSTKLSEFKLRASVLGALFLVGPLAFIVTSPIWGYLSRFKSFHGTFMIVGQFVLGVGFLVVLIPQGQLWSSSVSFALLESGLGIVLMIGMRCLMTGAYEMGYQENVETCAMVSGLFNTAYALGGFSGPFVGGLVVDHFGLANCYTAFGLINLCFTLVLVGCFSLRHVKANKKSTEPTLESRDER